MKYQDAMKYIEGCSTYGIVPGLETIRELLNRLGNPHQNLKIIHIAGTNGKGSVLAFLSTILQENGYKVGRYISPTIFEYNERFQIQQKPISKAEVGRLMEEAAVPSDEMEKEGWNHPTPFEIETAMAFLLFQKKKCDFVILETGMGGRLDATNVIDSSVLSVITSIGMDHMGYLGMTIKEIGQEKAGIIKAGGHIVSADQEDEVKEVLTEKSVKEKTDMLRFVSTDEIRNISYGLNNQSFSYKSNKKMVISLAGTWQVENACLALEGIYALQEMGYRFTEEKIKEGLRKTSWPGRFQVIAKKPYFIVDGAHNYPSAVQLRKSIEFYFTNKKIIYIIGMFRDKEVEKVLEEMCPLASHVITITIPDNQRSLSALELAGAAKKINDMVTAADSLEEAIELSHLLADKASVILAFGSLSYLGRCINVVEMRKDRW